MKAARTLAWVVLTELALLVATGVYLYFEYRPESSDADLLGPPDASVRAARLVRWVHQVDSRVVLLTLIALGIVVLLERLGRTRDRVSPWAILVVSIAASVTGLLLPWDQLALSAVTVGTNMSGYSPLFQNQVRFVLVGHAEVERQSILRWLAVHAGLGLAALVGAGWTVGSLRGAPSPSAERSDRHSLE